MKYLYMILRLFFEPKCKHTYFFLKELKTHTAIVRIHSCSICGKEKQDRIEYDFWSY